jgi:hypothetical protein
MVSLRDKRSSLFCSPVGANGERLCSNDARDGGDGDTTGKYGGAISPLGQIEERAGSDRFKQRLGAIRLFFTGTLHSAKRGGHLLGSLSDTFKLYSRLTSRY